MFEQGMRVRLLCRNPDGNETYTVGSEGIVCNETNPDRPGVRWDEYSGQAHDCDGMCDMGHGWYVNGEYLEIIGEIREFKDIDQDAFSAILLS